MRQELKSELDALRSYLGKIWTLLVGEAGASEDGRSLFLTCAMEYRSGRTLEYRFCGTLCFGGKVWLNNGPHPYVNCYSEDKTKKREKTIERVNLALSKIQPPAEGASR